VPWQQQFFAQYIITPEDQLGAFWSNGKLQLSLAGKNKQLISVMQSADILLKVRLQDSRQD